MTDFYVYIHTRNDTGEVFYVGKGKGPRAHHTHNRNRFWSNINKKHGHKVVVLERFASEHDAFAMERYLIASYRSMNCRLANMTDGGEGASGAVWSEQANAERAARLRTMARDPTLIAARVEARKSYVMTEETKAKIGAKSKLKTFTPEYRAKLKVGHTGIRHTAESKANISAANTGRSCSQESIARMREAQALARSKETEKRRHSEETKAKMSASRTALYKDPAERAKLSKPKPRVATRKD